MWLITSTTRVLAAALDLRTFTVPLLAQTAGVSQSTARSVLNRQAVYFTKSALPTGRRGGQLRSWSIRPDLSDDLAARVRADRAEDDAPLDPLHLSSGGELVSRLSQRTRTPEAHRELVTENELHEFDSQSGSLLLPELAVRLITRTPGLTNFSMRTGRGVGYPSFDGRVEISSEMWPVPGGYSVWELGAGANPVLKANDDYNKRTKNPEDVDRATSTFVFMTNRACPELEDWAAAKRELREWADVRAIDAETVFKWLLKNRPVHVWISERLGLRPTDVATLDNWFSEWRVQTKPAIPRLLLTSGRTKEAAQLRELAMRSGETIGVYSNSREESLAFVASVLSRDPIKPPDDESEFLREQVEPGEGRLAAGLIVKNAAEWSRILDEPSGDDLLIPRFGGGDVADVAKAVARGFTVIIPMGIGDDIKRASIVLPRIHVIQAMEALNEEHGTDDNVYGLAQTIDRSLTSFRRSHSVNLTNARPAWADEHPELLAALALLGGWNSDNGFDQEVVSKVTRQSHFDVEQELQRLAMKEDAPFIPSGNNWQLVDPDDAFALVAGVLTKGVLDRWVNTALPVLREVDPLIGLSPEENFTATIKGIRRNHSFALRSGIARGAALLGSSDRRLQGVSHADFAKRLVRELLVANPTNSNWRALADVLPSLAEAAPDEFLDATRTALDGTTPALAELFNDRGPAPLLGGDSPHTHLLWALELLAQSKDHAAEALFQLARLAEVDPGGRMNNRPAESLQRLLLVWYPQTALPFEDCLRVVTRIARDHPKVGWQLVLGLLPQSMGSSHRAYRPAFRDWQQPITMTLPEAIAAYSGYANLSLDLANEDPAKWKDLIPKIPYLPVADRDRFINFLEATDPNAWTEVVRIANFRSLTELVAKHRQFPTAQWAMPEEPLSRLEAIVSSWSPLDLVDRVSPLFALYPDIPDARRFSDHEAYREQAAIIQRRSLIQVLGSDEGALDRLVRSAPEPEIVGSTLADLAISELTQVPGADRPFFDWFEEEGAMKKAASGWLHRMLYLNDATWFLSALAEIAKLIEPARAFAYQLLRSYPDVLDVVAEETLNVQSAFWAAKGVEFMGSDRQADIVEGFMAHDNVAGALEYLSYRSHRYDVDSELVLKVLQTETLSFSTLQSGMAAYEIEHLLDKLELSGTEQAEIAALEWRYFPLLQHTRKPRAFFAWLRQHPDQFVALIEFVFKSASEETREQKPDDSIAAYSARVAYSLLQEWRTPPGTSPDGKIDSAELRSWVATARALLVESDRVDIGDECIGQLLSGSPNGSDGIWPAEPIRELLEDLSSLHVIDGLAIGRFNSRGTTSRGPSDGGDQERALSKQYEEWAAKVSPEWPTTGRLLREVSRTYEKWAVREDEMWEQWRDAR